ncbi:MAG: ABC transporter ATP-binding protein [Planctomycetota bacterium]|nr:MAG: ABC transporter ATP-binding protein [Planctomycetota bacterium]
MARESGNEDIQDKPLVEARGLGVSFGAQTVLRDIDLVVPRGQTLAIIGESGCGKTVFLKTMIGLVAPTSGEMLFDGKNLQQLSEKELTRQRIRFGFVFQNAALFDSLSIEQNVAFPLRQHTEMTDDEIREVVLARLSEVGLAPDVMPKKPAELSGGMRKRVGLARALAMNPDILLYDEPTTGLDPIMSDVIGELILETRKKHPITSVVVTHDMRVAQKVADRIVMLYPVARLAGDEPQILYDGEPGRIESARDERVGQFVRGEAGVGDQGSGVRGRGSNGTN